MHIESVWCLLLGCALHNICVFILFPIHAAKIVKPHSAQRGRAVNLHSSPAGHDAVALSPFPPHLLPECRNVVCCACMPARLSRLSGAQPLAAPCAQPWRRRPSRCQRATLGCANGRRRSGCARLRALWLRGRAAHGCACAPARRRTNCASASSARRGPATGHLSAVPFLGE